MNTEQFMKDIFELHQTVLGIWYMTYANMHGLSSRAFSQEQLQQIYASPISDQGVIQWGDRNLAFYVKNVDTLEDELITPELIVRFKVKPILMANYFQS